MKRSLNATGRVRIVREVVAASLAVSAEGSVRLRARLDLDKDQASLHALLAEHPEAPVWVSVSGLVYSQRFSLGRVGALRPLDVALPDPELLPAHPSIQVTVVEPTSGRILGIADDVPLEGGPAAVAGREALLPVEFLPLGGRAWRVVVGPDVGSELRLEIEEDIRDLEPGQRRDFAALVIPEAVERIVVDWYAPLHMEEGEDMPLLQAWRRKVRQLVGANEPEDIDEADGDALRDAWSRFAEQVADAFAREMLAVERLTTAWGDAE